ncbi:MAG: hypothetical protein J0J10_23245 [Bosea sp.]|uniref:hypothetical protein n=1 Tax=Bosea sp. (in: a-proteobacteria) TaxID=1871050 RepID=UPI001ACC952A|nr:hypothetical protein [Bosea sp. (in: a-proteobacteria)]MBN9471689.1 hypothetical protein [Bosea sp. (in: a-proteobacteria)]
MAATGLVDRITGSKPLTDALTMGRFAPFVKKDSTTRAQAVTVVVAASAVEVDMQDLGKELWAIFLDAACPLQSARPKLDFASAEEVSRLFFENAALAEAPAKETGHRWAPSGIVEVDFALRRLAESGRPDLELKLSPAGAEEFWRRWQYAIIAAQLEHAAGNEFSIPYPRHAPPIVQGTAVLLSILAGAARDYRREVFEHREQARGDRRPTR